ncbi:MAG: type I-MYXAN CRISPR-associated protein Cas6/Cmx6 [Cyanobacteriota bacterium]
MFSILTPIAKLSSKLPLVELRWSVMGDRLPADHNYRLYSALIERSPALKDVAWQLGTIAGTPDREGWIRIGSESSLTVRCALEDLGWFDRLDRQVLRVGRSVLRLGEMTGGTIQPCLRLRSRIVTIKANYRGQVSPFEFGVALGKQLADRSIRSVPILGDRMALRIKDKNIVGYAVAFENLSPHESIMLQTEGLGGRRRMGCGVFRHDG